MLLNEKVINFKVINIFEYYNFDKRSLSTPNFEFYCVLHLFLKAGQIANRFLKLPACL